MKRAKILSLALVVVLLALVIALFTIPVAAEETLPEAGQVMTEDVVTEYGTIPKEYANQTDYPFVLFGTKSSQPFVQGFKEWNSSANSGNDAVLWKAHQQTAANADRTILVRRDFEITAGSYANIGQLGGKEVLIDLQGHTLTVSSYNLFHFSAKSNKSNTIINIKNGYVELNGAGLVQIGNGFNQKNLDENKGPKSVTINFNNVEVKYKDGVTKASILINEANNNSNFTGTDHGATVPVNVNFDSCSIDLTGYSSAVTTILDGDNNTNKTNTNSVSFKNSTIKISDISKLKMAYITEGEDSISFGTNENDMLRFEIPVVPKETDDTDVKKAATIKSKITTIQKSAIHAESAVSYSIKYIADGEGDYKIFVPGEDISIDGYGRVAYAYADEQEYPFVWFQDQDKDGVAEFQSGEKHWSAGNSGNQEGVLLAAKDNAFRGLVKVLLRRDFQDTNGYFQYLGHINGTVEIDLGNHTLTDKHHPFFNAYQWYGPNHSSGERKPVFNVSNGNMLVEAKSLINIYTRNYAAGSGQVFEFNFENVNIGFTDNSGCEALVYCDNAGTSGQVTYANISFTDCNFDFTSPNAASSFIDLSLSTDNSYANIKIDGCNIKIGEGKNVELAKLTEDYDTLSFARVDGKYLTVEVAKGADAPTGEYVGENGAALVFKKTGETETTVIYELQLKAVADVNFTPKTSVTLGSDLTLNIYIPFIPEFSSMWFELTGADEKILAADITEDFLVTLEDGKKYIHVESPMSAFEAAAVIPLCVELEIGGSLYTGKWSISIPKYVEKVLAKSDIGTTEKTLAKDILAYIRSAFAFEGLENSDEVKAIDEILDGYTSDNTINVQNAIKDSDLVGATFVLDSTPAVRFYIGEYNYDQFTFFVGGKAVDEDYMTYGSDDDYGAYVDISLYAYQMTETFSYVIDVEEGNDITGSYNLISYYAYISGDGENDYDGADKALLTDLVAKFYNYCASAAAYRNN